MGMATRFPRQKVEYGRSGRGSEEVRTFGWGKKPRTMDRIAKFNIGQVVRHRIFPFRGVIFDVDPIFDNTEEWWLSIPEDIRPSKDQPYYHLFAENDETEYVAYVSEQNLVPDESGDPVRHPQVSETFEETEDGGYRSRDVHYN